MSAITPRIASFGRFNAQVRGICIGRFRGITRLVRTDPEPLSEARVPQHMQYQGPATPPMQLAG
ncbi:hypothetical protein GGTG_05713 [Gaeumannomyces tritici R3-111a-1]|uniref:Uncharacterized protein n=1 Tax=Gaeumannomyces tritici (strain R3-111a-1) TaxID=644352 RepID=J3NWQ1_GAET3|nr:hypothetical protein GGTG_05713 [Gaeumannomyces tritici R3-111a-1]EJT75783.1 hypothetical protein GGTG_05713 [Gaeumannomyces tritici R3-111a-1]